MDIASQLRDAIAVKEAILRDLTGPIEKAGRVMADCLRAGNKILFFGNGGSASDSQHLAAEFVGRYEKERRALSAIALTTDTSILTAVGNDYGFEEVFSRQVAAIGRKGDVAVAISTSGNSPNVLRAMKLARQMGIYVIAFSGRDGGKMRSEADLSLVIPSQKTSRIQESHIMIGHLLCEYVDEALAHGA